MINKKLVLVFLIAFVTISSLITLFLVLNNEKQNVQTGLTLLEPENQKSLPPSFLNNDGDDLIKKFPSNSKKSSENFRVELISDEKAEDSEISSFTEEPDKIFKIAGEEYIMRDGGEYKIDTNVIQFSKVLPSKICSNLNEVIDEVQLDLGIVSLSLGWDASSCATAILYTSAWNVPIKYCLMEDDLSGDDEIQCKESSARTYDCKTLNLENEYGNIIKKKFTDVKFSSFFGGVEGNTIEVYAKVSNPNGYFESYSTSIYDIDKIDCDCLSGACCDTSNRPYYFKSSGSQPINYTDEYFCSGTNSATGTSYTNLRDWYCDGKSSSAKSKESSKNICGTCKYCEEGFLSCKNYDSSTACGTNKHCDGAGTCIDCKSHNSASCYDNDIYWFNECGNVEEKKTECGDSGYSGNNYCYDNDVYRDYVTKGCSSNSCSSSTTKEKQTECQYGCENAKCKSNPNIKCSKNLDCGVDSYGNTFCSEGNVRQDYTTYTCNNPGTVQSSCTSKQTYFQKEDCKGNGCTDGKCNTSPSLKRPDLTIEDLIVQSISGKEVVLGFTIKNIDEAVANSVYWMVDSGSSNISFKRTSSISLGSGNFTRAFMIFNYSKSGTYSAKVIVDFDKIIAESNETNNEKSISVSV